MVKTSLRDNKIYYVVYKTGCYLVLLVTGCYLVFLVTGCYLVFLVTGCYLVLLVTGCYLVFLVTGCYLVFLVTGCYLVFRSVGPLVALLVLNMFLIRALHATRRRHQKISATTSSRRSKHRENVTLILVVVVSVFIVCQLPDLALRIAGVAGISHDRFASQRTRRKNVIIAECGLTTVHCAMSVLYKANFICIGLLLLSSPSPHNLCYILRKHQP